MPPCKTTAAGPSKRRRAGPAQVFYNNQAEGTYNSCLVKRMGIRERGLCSSYTQRIVESRKWQKFTEQPNPAVLPVVREFYANARVMLTADPTERAILVRGQLVPFNSATINELFDLEDMDEDDYSAWLAQGPDYDAVIARIAKDGSRWKRQNDKVISFLRRQLGFVSKAWHYFISARLLPSNHVSDVTRDRSLLIYAIQTGLSINIGKIIERSIVGFATGRVTSSLGHPTLICELCLLAGVSFRPKEQLQPPLPTIDDACMESFEKIGNLNQRDSSSSPSRERAETPASMPQSDGGLSKLHKQVKELRIDMDKVQRTQRRHSRQMDYVVECCKALGSVYQMSCGQQGSSSTGYPAPPTLSSSQSDEEEDSDD